LLFIVFLSAFLTRNGNSFGEREVYLFPPWIPVTVLSFLSVPPWRRKSSLSSLGSCTPIFLFMGIRISFLLRQLFCFSFSAIRRTFPPEEGVLSVHRSCRLPQWTFLAFQRAANSGPCTVTGNNVAPPSSIKIDLPKTCRCRNPF